MKQTIKFLLVNLLCTLFCIANASLVQLSPPPLQQSTMMRAWCDRPKREKGINISVNRVEEKTIVHCYGHGGMGFTTLFGSIQEAIRLLSEHHIDHNQPIRIIGAGCMGLLLAIELYRQGFYSITISAKELYDIPSWRAGGFFDPGTGAETTPEDRFMLKLGLSTYTTLYSIEQGTHPYLTTSVVKKLPLYAADDIQCGIEILEKLGFMPPSEPVTLDFGAGVTHEHYLRHYTYFINVSELMKQLWEQVRKLHIPIVCEEITSFDQCHESIICNCTGLGSSTLNADATVYPARGHFFMLHNTTDTQHMHYALFTKVQQGDKKEYIYFFPKDSFVSSEQQSGMPCCGMLGGTFVRDVDKLSCDERNQLDLQEWNNLFLRAKIFFMGNTL